MALRRTNVVYLATLAAAALIAGQSAPAAAPIASIPDFTGMWAHPWLPGFEPLASGPTSLTNRERRPVAVSNVLKLVGDYTNPILKPETAATVKRFGELSLAHYGFHNPRNQSWPNELPFILSSNGMET